MQIKLVPIRVQLLCQFNYMLCLWPQRGLVQQAIISCIIRQMKSTAQSQIVIDFMTVRPKILILHVCQQTEVINKCPVPLISPLDLLACYSFPV